jgi:choline dehydrogenase-like flavoprotein
MLCLSMLSVLLTKELHRLGTLYPRGATLGGSSQANAMNFIKARDEDVGCWRSINIFALA